MAEIDLKKITEVIKGIVEGMDFRLYDLNYNDVAKILRVYIDRKGSGVTIKDCEAVSNAISQELDRLDVINFHYTLEVSSPGIERPLSKPEHYKWANGKLIEVVLKEGNLRGYLRDATEEDIVISSKTGEIRIPYHQILKAKVIEEY